MSLISIFDNEIIREDNQPKNDTIPIPLNTDHISTEELKISQSQESLMQLEEQQNKPIYSYDIELLKYPLADSKLVRRITQNVDVFPQLLGELRIYKFFKKFAIERLAETLWRQINLMFYFDNCGDKNEEPGSELAHEIFSWTIEEYRKRRMLENFVWVDVMLMSTQTCLEKYKYKKDLQELQSCIQCIFEGLLGHIAGATSDQTERIVKHISNTKLVLEFYNYMDQELKYNENQLQELYVLDDTINQIKRDSEKRFTAILLRHQINNNHVLSPIEMRYQFNSLRTHVNQWLFFKDLSEKRLSKDILALKKKKGIEKAFDNNCMDYFYTTIDNLKSTINSVQFQFDELSEKMENILNIKRGRLDKLRDKRKLMEKEMIRFREEINVKDMQEEAEKAEIERKQLQKEEEEAMAAKLLEEEAERKRKRKNKKPKK